MGTQEEILKELKEQVEQNKKALTNSEKITELEKRNFHQQKKQTGFLKKIALGFGGLGVTGSAIAMPIEMALKPKDDGFVKAIQKLNEGQIPSNVELRKMVDDLLEKIHILDKGQIPSNIELRKMVDDLLLKIKDNEKNIEIINSVMAVLKRKVNKGE